MKIFLSGGFHSNWQKKVIDGSPESFIFFNPREHLLDTPEQYTCWDLHFVKQCDLVFAYMEDSNPSGFGLAFEVGYALGLNKTIILVDEKSKTDEKFERYFKIVHKSSNVVFHSLQEGIDFLSKLNT